MNPVLPKYPECEQSLLADIRQLMAEWKAAMGDWWRNEWALRGKDSLGDIPFTSDGFYPYYTQQPIKVLFVGREGIGLADCDYIEVLHQAYKQGRVETKSLNRHCFHRRILYMLYGIQNGFPAWEDVPPADVIARDFATAGGLSCAFLNISKISNERETYQTDWEVLKASLVPGTPFLQREIELLNPDLIISANVSPIEVKAFRTPPELLSKHPEDLLDIHHCELNGRSIYWFNTFHFSAFARGRGNSGLNDYQSFYLPVKEAVEFLGDRATPLCQS